MMTTINSDTKIAVAQFGNPDDEELIIMAKEFSEQGIHWYYFDETADKEFELAQLCEHYDMVFDLDEGAEYEKNDL